MNKIIFSVIVLVMIFFGMYAEYSAVKKYYPGLTFWEYIILEHKLRITPEGKWDH